ncbi:hypothetical protein HWV62_5161 [Athelia sp. TMB]|nr:hypothetical protein HWV62_5161 [Athelia sp. TMB]
MAGSNALQFLERTHYEHSDLDIYVHPGQGREVGVYLMDEEGYRYAGGSGLLASSSDTNNTELFSLDEMDAREGSYTGGSIFDVLQFFKHTSKGQRLDVHLILAMTSPIETIMRFHSSKSLTTISLYPKATFEFETNQRCSLELAGRTPEQTENAELQATGAVLKYEGRGKSSVPWPQRTSSRSAFFIDKCRFVGDRFCWTQRLDLGGLVAVPFATTPGSRLYMDTVVNNGWIVKVTGDRLTTMYSIMTSKALRFDYICPNVDTRSAWERVFSQLKFEDNEDNEGLEDW